MEPLCTWGFYKPALFIQRLSSLSDEKKLQYYNWLIYMLPQPNITCLKKILMELFIPIEVFLFFLLSFSSLSLSPPLN